MKKKLKVVSLSPKLKKEARAVLETALGYDFTTVIIFGFKETGTGEKELHTLHSSSASRLETMGALEFAKYLFFPKKQ